MINIMPISAKGMDNNAANVILTSILNMRIIRQIGVSMPVTKSPICSAKNFSMEEQSSATAFFYVAAAVFGKEAQFHL